MIASAWNETELLATFARVCDGLADDAEVERLEQRLTSDPRARQLWLEYASVHGGVAQHLDGAASLVDWPVVFGTNGEGREEKGEGRSTRGVGAVVIAVSRFARRYPVISCTVALLVVSLTIALLALVNLPERRRRLADGAVEPQFVAQLTRVHLAQWAEGQVGGAEGSHLQPGHVYRLQSGMAEIMFRSGAKVVLEGPAQFHLRSTNSGWLEAGKLAAIVPQAAHGFVIETKRGRIVDLGTRFAVDVSPQGRVAVHCFRGEVAFAAPQRRPVRLTAGKALENAGGVERLVVADARSFVHDLRLHGDLQHDVRGLVIDSRFAHNAALGKSATQSSTLGEYTADKSIDGDPTNFTHTTAEDAAAWLMIDLGAPHDIDAIVLHNRDACCGARLREVTIEILADDGQTIAFASPVLNENNQLQAPAMLAIGLPELTGDMVRGRYVRVRRAALAAQADAAAHLMDLRVLSLGEVQIFASLVEASVKAKVEADAAAPAKQ